MHKLMNEWIASPSLSVSYDYRNTGPYLAVPGFTSDAFAPSVNVYRHLEYLPLINERAHEVTTTALDLDLARGVQRRHKIQNKEFREQYVKFLQYLVYASSCRENISTRHLMSAVYYMLLQDRIPEAKKLFAMLDARRTVASANNASDSAADDNSVGLQLDYLTAYFDMFSLAPGNCGDAAALRAGAARAIAIADKYTTYPVRMWRKMFADVKAHVNEALETISAAADGGAGGNGVPAFAGPAAGIGACVLTSGVLSQDNTSAEVRASNRTKELDALASTEPQLEFTVEKSAGAAAGAALSLKLVHANLASCIVSFHLMDLEALFSASPFISGEMDKFALVAPNHALKVDLTGAVPSAEHGFMGVTMVAVPAKFATANVHIQVRVQHVVF